MIFFSYTMIPFLTFASSEMLNFVGPEFASGRFISSVGSDKLTKLHVTTLRHKLAMPNILRRKYSVT